MELNSNIPEPRKVGVWAEGSHIAAREYVIPKKSPETSDDIPTLPDLDDFQDMLEKDVTSVIKSQKDIETVNTLAEVGSGITGSLEGIDAVLDILKSHIPEVEMDIADTLWTVDTLLTQLADENNGTSDKK